MTNADLVSQTLETTSLAYDRLRQPRHGEVLRIQTSGHAHAYSTSLEGEHMHLRTHVRTFLELTDGPFNDIRSRGDNLSTTGQ
jgi:hypothetical protein